MQLRRLASTLPLLLNTIPHHIHTISSAILSIPSHQLRQLQGISRLQLYTLLCWSPVYTYGQSNYLLHFSNPTPPFQWCNCITQTIDIPLWTFPGQVTPFTFLCNFRSIPHVSYCWDTTSSPATIHWLTGYWAVTSSPLQTKRILYSDYRPPVRATISEEMSHKQFPTTLTPTSGKIIQLWTFRKTMTATQKIDISLVNNVAYLWICELPGTQQFTFNLKDISACVSSTSNSTPVDFPPSWKITMTSQQGQGCYACSAPAPQSEDQPWRGHNSATQTNILPNHRPSSLPSEISMTKHLFIWPPQSPHGAPILL